MKAALETRSLSMFLSQVCTDPGGSLTNQSAAMIRVVGYRCFFLFLQGVGTVWNVLVIKGMNKTKRYFPFPLYFP